MSGVALKLTEHFQGVELTERELAVLQLMVAGKSNHEISAALGVVEATVKFHVKNILAKLGVSDRLQASHNSSETWFNPPLDLHNLFGSIGITLT